MAELTFKTLIACLPVLALAAILYRLDSHRLLGTRMLARVFVMGGGVAVLSAFVNGAVLARYPFEFLDYTRYVAPLIEETLKALVLVWLFRTNRVGFLIDAGILGFTVGAGFSFVENLYHLWQASEAHYGTWFVRGFGTAVMHGGATALFAIIAQKLTERHLRMSPLLYVPGLILAVLIHSIFNHFPVSPVLSATVTLLIVPTLLFLLFERNTRTIHDFLELDFAAHQRLLRQLEHGEFTGCEAGRFLQDVQDIVSGPVAREMLDYFYLHTELVLGAERILLAREQGVEIRVGAETVSKLEEMHRLERHIGKAGLRMLRRHLHFSSTELWDIHLLDDIAPAHRPAAG